MFKNKNSFPSRWFTEPNASFRAVVVVVYRSMSCQETFKGQPCKTGKFLEGLIRETAIFNRSDPVVRPQSGGESLHKHHQVNNRNWFFPKEVILFLIQSADNFFLRENRCLFDFTKLFRNCPFRAIYDRVVCVWVFETNVKGKYFRTQFTWEGILRSRA